MDQDVRILITIGMDQGVRLPSWRWSLPLPTNPVWWRSMQAISSYRGTDWHRPSASPSARDGRLQYTAPQLSAQCKNTKPVVMSVSYIHLRLAVVKFKYAAAYISAYNL